MIGAGRMRRFLVRNGNLGQSRTNDYPMTMAPSHQGCFSKTETAFNGAHGFTPKPMTFSDEPFNKRFVPEIYWHPSTIISIADVKYKRRVWNLAVSEDETYVAGGVIVHNCRSLLVPILTGEDFELSKMPSSSMQPGGFLTLEK